jgi:hypothetical protein
MSVKVQNEGHFPLLSYLVEVFFDVSGLMKIFGPIPPVPTPVEIVTKEISSVVASSHSIGIDHRDDFYLIVSSQIFPLLILGE